MTKRTLHIHKFLLTHSLQSLRPATENDRSPTVRHALQHLQVTTYVWFTTMVYYHLTLWYLPRTESVDKTLLTRRQL